MIWLDVYAGSTLQEAGPVVQLVTFEARSKLSAAGDWAATAPAGDLRAASLLLAGRTALAYRMTPDGVEFIGGGQITDVRTRIDANGALTLDVTGVDLLAEMAQVTAGYVESSDGEATLRAAMPAGWTIVESDTLPVWTARYAHESVLAAWVRATERAGFRFRLAPSGSTIRRMQLLNSTPDSGVRAYLVADPVAVEEVDTICLLRNIEEAASVTDIVNRMYVYGAGNWETRLTLALATQWPNGAAPGGGYTDGAGNTFTVNLAESRLDCTSSQTAYGVRAAAIQFADIAPLTNSTADMNSAANALLRAACLDMAARATAQYAYRLEVAGPRSPVLPGDSIYVDAQKWVDGARPINIQRTLTVLDTTLRYRDGQIEHGLTVATTERMPASDAGAVASAIQGAITMAALPQASTTVDTICASDALDDEALATFRFWLGNEAGRIYQILMRYRVDPLRSTAKSLGGSVEGDITLAGHTHDVTIPAHDHDIPDHQHRIGVSQGSGGRNVGLYTGGGLYYEGTDVGVVSLYTTSDSGATTSDSGGGSTPTSASGGGGTFDVDLTSALTLDYGIYEESGANTYGYSDLDWTCNGDAVTETPTSLGSGWYSLDLTDYVVAADGVRPATAANAVTVAIKTASEAGKTCQVTVQIERRFSVQPIAYR